MIIHPFCPQMSTGAAVSILSPKIIHDHMMRMSINIPWVYPWIYNRDLCSIYYSHSRPPPWIIMNLWAQVAVQKQDDFVPESGGPSGAPAALLPMGWSPMVFDDLSWCVSIVSYIWMFLNQCVVMCMMFYVGLGWKTTMLSISIFISSQIIALFGGSAFHLFFLRRSFVARSWRMVVHIIWPVSWSSSYERVLLYYRRFTRKNEDLKSTFGINMAYVEGSGQAEKTMCEPTWATPPKSHFHVKWCFQIKLVFKKKGYVKGEGQGVPKKKCIFFSNISIQNLHTSTCFEQVPRPQLPEWHSGKESISWLTMRAVKKCHHIRPMHVGDMFACVFRYCLVVKISFSFSHRVSASTHVFIVYLLWYVYFRVSFRSPNWHPSLQDGYVRD